MDRELLDQDGDQGRVGQRMYELIEELYPICRSITGNGVRQTLNILARIIPLKVHEVPSGTQVFDWVVPKEWNIREAYIKNSKGEKIVDFRKSNLHVLNYSIPVHKKVSLKELRKHLYTLPEHPTWIPYRTSYYVPNWGFCMSHAQFLALTEDVYEVRIDSSLEDGHLVYGECLIRGKTTEEVLISTHICHPSLCNDNLSGIALSTFLAQALKGRDLHFSYRFVFIPATIGAIAWLAVNEDKVKNIKHGLVAALVGDPGAFTYKKSRRGNAEIDRIVEYVLQNSGKPYRIREFSPYGYDERQYCSPGFDLPVGCLMRTPNREFPEYHTSADNLHFVRPECLAESFAVYSRIVNVIEQNRKYLNLNPKCEPQLGRRGLYKTASGMIEDEELAMLWILNLSDGRHSLLDIAERSDINFETLAQVARKLVKHRLLAES